MQIMQIRGHIYDIMISVRINTVTYILTWFFTTTVQVAASATVEHTNTINNCNHCKCNAYDLDNTRCHNVHVLTGAWHDEYLSAGLPCPPAAAATLLGCLA